MTKLRVYTDKRFSDLTTFHIGGKIKYYIEVKNNDEVCEAATLAAENKLPVFVLGGGSDILVEDKDFNGVVVKFIGKEIRIEGNNITAGAGLEWDKLVEVAVKNNLQGIECLSGIPGTVGGAPIQNIGAYGQEIKNVFVKLTAYGLDEKEFLEFTNADCKFDYRESVFKTPDFWQKFIICDVSLKLNPNKKPEIAYDSLKSYLTENGIKNPDLGEIRRSVLAIRAGKFEKPEEAGNAGSFFKNPVLSSKEVKELKKKYPQMPAREQADGSYKCMAGWFIEMAGWKGKKFKNTAVSSKHALILLNPGKKASAEEIVELSDDIIEDVRRKFGVKLVKEVQLIHFGDLKVRTA